MNNKKRKKKNKNEIEQMTAEEAFGYYFIAGFTGGWRALWNIYGRSRRTRIIR